MLAGADPAARFVLELAAIASIAYWGWQTGGPGLAGILLGVGAALVLVLTWWAFIAPRSRSPIPEGVRPYVGSVLLLGSACLLAIAGQPVLGVILGILVLVNATIMAATGMRS